MADVPARTMREEVIELGEKTLNELKGRMRGPVLLPGDRRYDEARALWNARIDRRPALIARCVNVADVTAALGFGREHDLLIAIRGGGTTSPATPCVTAGS